MKLSPLWVSALFAVATLLPAQEPVSNEPPPLFTPAQLEQLLGPVALYPDTLVALILPAATAASDIVLAARYLQAQGDAAQLDEQPWEDSVKALARYPTVVTWMDQNLAWTKQVGDAFAAQPADVMNAIQRLRAQARAAGTLTDSAQQQVIIDDADIRIVPAQADVVYIPYYDPAVVYVTRRVYYPQPFVRFSVGFSVGSWLAYDCDWRRRTIWVVNRPARHRVWRERIDCRQPVFATPICRSEPATLHAWRPPSARRSHFTHPAYPHYRDNDRPRRAVNRYATVEAQTPWPPSPSIRERDETPRRIRPVGRPQPTTSWNERRTVPVPRPEAESHVVPAPPRPAAPVPVINGRRVVGADERLRELRERNERNALERRANFPHRNSNLAPTRNRETRTVEAPPPVMSPPRREVTRTPPLPRTAERQQGFRPQPRAALTPPQPTAARNTSRPDDDGRKPKRRNIE